MKKQMYFILLAVILFFCFKEQITYAEETPLQVEDNWLTQEVARQVGKSDVKKLTQEDFKKITKLEYSSGHVSYIPKEIAYLKKLTYFSLSRQTISEIPQELFLLHNLETLEITRNNLTVIPKDIVNLRNLKSLDLSENEISEVPQEIEQLNNLKSFSLHGNRLNKFPNEILALSNLNSLSLGGNNIEIIPETISTLSNLTSLSMPYSNVKVIPKSIGQLTKLKYLTLFDNQIEKIPPEFGQLKSLNLLFLDQNKIHTLPNSLFNLKNLEQLYLSENELENLPRKIGLLTNLKNLGLSNNHLANIPEEICQLSKLISLNLSNNRLTKIPDSIDKLKDLEFIAASNNELTNIPKSISNLIKLKEARFEYNKISKIPFEYKVKNGFFRVYNQNITLPVKKIIKNVNFKIKNVISVTNSSITVDDNLYAHATLYLNIDNKGTFIKNSNSISWKVNNTTSNELSYTFNMYKNNQPYVAQFYFGGTVIQPIEIIDEIPLTEINLKKSELNLQVGKSALNEVVYNPQDTTDDKTVAWTSSNRNIATVTSKGKITGVSSGSAIVKAQVGKFTATCKVIVKDNSKPSENKIYFTDDYKDKTVTKDETIRIPIKLSTIKDYYALDSSIKYDKSKLEFLGYSIKENYKDCYADSSDVDILRFILASKGKNNPIKTSDDPIIYLNFKCIAAGDADVTITSTALANLDEEVNVKVDNLDKTTIHITETSRQTDINRDGKFSLIDLAIDAYYYGVDADETDKTKYDADIIPDGKIDDLDLIEITNNIINGK